VVIVSGIAKDENCGLGSDFASVLLPKDFKGVAVVRVAIDPNNIGLGVHSVNSDTDVFDALEILRDLIETVDKDK
jgi:hypothetical protein